MLYSTVSLSSPIIFLPDPRPHIDKWVLLNLGKVNINTIMVETSQLINDEIVNYGKFTIINLNEFYRSAYL